MTQNFSDGQDLSTNWQKIAKQSGKVGNGQCAGREESVSGLERIQVDNGKLDFSTWSLPLDFSSRSMS